jgi:Ca2+-binding RTX toxin-like protein
MGPACRSSGPRRCPKKWYEAVNYERGRGAWIDAGDGDDIVSGTDAHDIIIGGKGSDWMDGQAGADTYIIGRDAGSVDYIEDVASFTPDSLFEVYGGRLDDRKQDTVEFDDSVDRAQLGYRWNDTTLELLHGGELFLEIDYDGAVTPGERGLAGIERFVFSGGDTLSLDQLLAELPEVART